MIAEQKKMEENEIWDLCIKMRAKELLASEPQLLDENPILLSEYLGLCLFIDEKIKSFSKEQWIKVLEKYNELLRDLKIDNDNGEN